MKTYWRVSLEQTTTLGEVLQCIIPLLIINTIHLPSTTKPRQPGELSPHLSCCEEITPAVREDIPGNDISFPARVGDVLHCKDYTGCDV